MRAGDGDRPFQPHQLAQHLGAPDDRQPAGSGRYDLWIVGLDRGGDYDDLGAVEIFGAVADRDRDAEIDEPAGIGAFGEVAALHAVAEIVQDLGDTAHADAADPDKMQRADRSGQRSHAARLFFALPTSGASPIANAARRSAA